MCIIRETCNKLNLAKPFSVRAGPGALLVLAPPCSSWTRVSRGTTMRTKMNPLGLSYEFVLEANITIGRLLDFLTPINRSVLYK